MKGEKNEFKKFFRSRDYLKLKNYLFNYKLRKKIIHDEFSKIASNLKDADEAVVLDIGSGISPVSALLEKTIFVELESDAVKLLKSMKINAIRGDMTNLKFKDNSVDAIFCSEVLEHIPNYKKALSESARVLKKNGVIIITVPVHMKYWHEDDEFVGHFRRFNPYSLVKDIKKFNFKIISVKPVGSRLERFFTRNLVKISRKKSGNLKLNALKVGAFRALNYFLFILALLATKISSLDNSSIVLISAKKI